jgi:hypothetical protein
MGIVAAMPALCAEPCHVAWALGVLMATATLQAQQSVPAEPTAATKVAPCFDYVRATATSSCVYTIERVEIRIPNIEEERAAPLVAALLALSTGPAVAADSTQLTETVDKLRELGNAIQALAAPPDGKAPPAWGGISQQTTVVVMGDGFRVENDVDRTLRPFPSVVTTAGEQLKWNRDNNQVDYRIGNALTGTQIDPSSLLRPLPVDQALQKGPADASWSQRVRGEGTSRATMLTSTSPSMRLEIALDDSDLPMRAVLTAGAGPPREAGFYAHALVGEGADQRRFLSASVIVSWQKSRLVVKSSRLTHVSFAPPSKEQRSMVVPADAKIFVFRQGASTSMLPIDKPDVWPEFLKRHLRVE